MLGIHPEGTRNKGDDPYAFLPAQPGVGRIALGATRAHVIPVFVLGMGQSITGEWRMNWLAPDDHPVDVYFGAPIDFSDLQPKANMVTTQKRAADRCLDAIKVLADLQRRDAAIREGRDPDTVVVLEKSDDGARTAAAAAKVRERSQRRECRSRRRGCRPRSSRRQRSWRESSPPRAPKPFWRSGTALIFLGLVLGVVLGGFLPADRHPTAFAFFQFCSKGFLTLIKGIIVPLLVATIITGIAQTGDLKAVGRMGAKSLVYFEVVTTIALFLGLGIANWLRPGDGLPHQGRRAHGARHPEDRLGDRAPRVPVERDRARREGRHPPGRRVRDALRHRAHAHRRAWRAGAALLRRRRAGDVQVHGHGHVAHADRRVRRDGLQREPHGLGAGRATASRAGRPSSIS